VKFCRRRTTVSRHIGWWESYTGASSYVVCLPPSQLFPRTIKVRVSSTCGNYMFRKCATVACTRIMLIPLFQGRCSFVRVCGQHATSVLGDKFHVFSSSFASIRRKEERSRARAPKKKKKKKEEEEDSKERFDLLTTTVAVQHECVSIRPTRAVRRAVRLPRNNVTCYLSCSDVFKCEVSAKRA